MAQAAHVGAIHEGVLPRALPVREIGTEDLRAAFRRGLDDFRVMPTHSIFLGIFYAVVGLVLFQSVFRGGLLQLAFPLIAGFALVGPLAALGLYELSRRRERGLDTSRWRMFSVIGSPAAGSILALGAVLAVIFFLWLSVAHGLYTSVIGQAPDSFGAFLGTMLGTSGGWFLILVGNAIGACFAIVAFAISVVSFPVLLDRHVGVLTAVATSLAAVRANPRTMLLWGLAVAVAFGIGCIPAFLGLGIIFPILGHASWHLYRAVVPS